MLHYTARPLGQAHRLNNIVMLGQAHRLNNIVLLSLWTGMLISTFCEQVGQCSGLLETFVCSQTTEFSLIKILHNSLVDYAVRVSVSLPPFGIVICTFSGFCYKFVYKITWHTCNPFLLYLYTNILCSTCNLKSGQIYNNNNKCSKELHTTVPWL